MGMDGGGGGERENCGGVELGWVGEEEGMKKERKKERGHFGLFTLKFYCIQVKISFLILT